MHILPNKKNLNLKIKSGEKMQTACMESWLYGLLADQLDQLT